MDLATFLVQCLNAVQYGLLLFLVASGLTLIFGIMGVINLAHGSFYMMGAYLAFSIAPLFGPNFLLMLLAGTLPLGELMTYPVYRLFASAACIAVGAALYLVVNKTRLGMMIRAGASNRDMVRGLGIDITRLYRIVFAGGVALAALAGMIAAPMSSVYPGMGGHILIICFVVVVIGGIGSVSGAFIASLLVGFVDTFGKVFFAELSGIGVYLLMAVILVWRPEGLMKRGY